MNWADGFQAYSKSLYTALLEFLQMQYTSLSESAKHK